jgi:phosphoglycerate kinase
MIIQLNSSLNPINSLALDFPCLLNSISNSSVFLRVDFNLPLEKGIDGKFCVSDSTRIEKTIQTIRRLVENKNKIIIASHLGRPSGNGFEEKFSMKPVFKKFSEIIFDPGLQINLIFCKDFEELEFQFQKQTGPESQIFFFENLRFWKGEEENNPDFKAKFKKLTKYYVNDAFACSHRAHGSIMLSREFDSKHKTFGLLLQSEVQKIKEFFNKPKKDQKKIAIIGGSKISTKIRLIKFLAQEFDYIFLGGAMANMILFFLGCEIGLSLKEDLNVELKEFLNEILNHSKCKIIIPNDFVCAKERISQDDSNVFYAEKIEKNHIILDIGTKTISDLKSVIDECGEVIWNGPLGFFENKNFAKGTKEIAEYIGLKTSIGKIKSLIGGGDSISAINKFEIPFESFSHVSTAGGAFLEFIENGLCLPGLEDF